MMKEKNVCAVGTPPLVARAEDGVDEVWLESVAATPLEGEWCDEAPDCLQSWVDREHAYERLAEIVLQARERCARYRKIEEAVGRVESGAGELGETPGVVLEGLVLEISTERGIQAANRVAGRESRENVLNRWNVWASDQNKQGRGQLARVIFSLLGVEEGERRIRERIVRYGLVASAVSRAYSELQKVGEHGDELLDELILDIAEELGATRANQTSDRVSQEEELDRTYGWASEQNNLDRNARVALIFSHWGEEEGERRIRELAQDFLNGTQ